LRVQLIYKSEQRVAPLTDCVERLYDLGIRLECSQAKTEVNAELSRTDADLTLVQHEVAGGWVDKRCVIFETIRRPPPCQSQAASAGGGNRQAVVAGTQGSLEPLRLAPSLRADPWRVRSGGRHVRYRVPA